jgi:hypothetical protein
MGEVLRIAVTVANCRDCRDSRLRPPASTIQRWPALRGALLAGATARIVKPSQPGESKGGEGVPSCALLVGGILLGGGLSVKRTLPTWRSASLALVTLGASLAGGATNARVAAQEAAQDAASLAGAAPTAPLVDQYVTQTAAQSSPLVESYDPAVTTGGVYGPELEHDGHVPIRSSQPINWISGPYVKAGPATAIGGGIIGDHEAGWTISGGYRQPMSPALDERLFLDMGGSYMSVFGERTLNTSAFVTPAVGDQFVVQNAFSTLLDEVQRAGVHAAFGWYWGAPIDVRSNDPQLRIATRLGGRWSHIIGQFTDTQLIAPPAGATQRTNYCNSDTAGGLYVGTEVMLLNRDWAGGSVQWTLDAEIANDWIDFEGFESGSLGTATIMLGWMYSR